MLSTEQQETNEPTPLPSQAPARVTADEFTAAVKAIEARRAAEANHVAGTIEIESTLRELGIDAAPEDVAREVEAMRAAKAAKDKAAGDAKERAKQMAMSAAQKGWEALKTAAEESRENSRRRAAAQPVMVAPVYYQGPKKRRGLMLGLWFAAFMAFLPSIMSLALHPITYNIPIGEMAASLAAPTMTPLSQIKDGELFYVKNNGIDMFLRSGGHITNAEKALPVTTEVSHDAWQMVKHDGVLYLRGYTAPGSDFLFGKQTVQVRNTLYGAPTLGLLDAPTLSSFEHVTVPLTGVKLDGQAVVSSSGATTLPLKNVVPDTHLRDNWTRG